MIMAARTFLMCFLLAAVTFEATACQTSGSTNGSTSPDAFAAALTSEDGRNLYLAGDSGGHNAGEESTFEVTARNATDEAWRDGYCLLLVDKDTVQSRLAHGQISLAPQAGVADKIRVTLPDGVPDGDYGLVLLVPGRGTLAATVHVGTSGAGEQPGPWGYSPVCASGRLPDGAFSVEHQTFTGNLTPGGANGR